MECQPYFPSIRSMTRRWCGGDIGGLGLEESQVSQVSQVSRVRHGIQLDLIKSGGLSEGELIKLEATRSNVVLIMKSVLDNYWNAP